MIGPPPTQCYEVSSSRSVTQCWICEIYLFERLKAEPASSEGDAERWFPFYVPRNSLRDFEHVPLSGLRYVLSEEQYSVGDVIPRVHC